MYNERMPSSTMNIWLILSYYWPHVKKFKWSGIFVLVFFALGAVGSELLSPILYKRIVDLVTGMAEPAVVGPDLIRTVFLIGLVILYHETMYRCGDFTMTFFQTRALKEISDDAFARLERHSYAFFANTFTGSLVAKVRRYVDAFENIHDQFVFSAWRQGLVLIFSVGVLTWYSRILGGFFLVWLLIYVIVTYLFTKRKFKKDLLSAQANSKRTAALADAITNIVNIKMFARSKQEHERFKRVTAIEAMFRKQAWNFHNIQSMIQAYLIGAFEFMGMFTAIVLWIKGMITPGTIVLMQIYLFSAFHVVWDMGRNFSRVMRSFAEAQEMIDIFEAPPEVQDVAHPKECRISKGHIKIKNITFAYGKGGRVFRNFSLELMPGEKIGLVGASGSGKTTITKLLLRFADVQKGKIIIDGQDIAELRQSDLRRKIAYVPQEPILFHRTLEENIAYGQLHASKKAILRAAEQAHAHEFIRKLPKGYKTMVGERGIKLSGGQRQRVAIARAMLKNAPILILDEATSSLDSLSERYIQEAFGELMKGRTTIVVAHRLSTIQQMDRILVIDEGRICEQGSHQELLRNKGHYSRLWKQQVFGFMGKSS